MNGDEWYFLLGIFWLVNLGSWVFVRIWEKK